ncbi:hypothetical protein GCM10022247_56710 [Allokutzneria multivorans]|uniref:HTH cro/C1-type domain-containing protein n=1 Tax=Allokutzneria multivorans TaxID=1142134 RepID=A0ABP7TE02_9PSEU
MDDLGALLGFDERDPQQRLASELNEADYAWVEALVALRKKRGLSQTQLGELMGRSQSVVSDIESMSTDPRLSTLRRYAIAVQASVEHQVQDSVRIVNVPVELSQASTVEQAWTQRLRIKSSPTSTGFRNLGNAVKVANRV